MHVYNEKRVAQNVSSEGNFARASGLSTIAVIMTWPLLPDNQNHLKHLEDPTVGFSAKRAALAAGYTSEPSTSVPIATGLKPVDTPTAAPVEVPQWFCRSRQQPFGRTKKSVVRAYSMARHSVVQVYASLDVCGVGLVTDG
ncbi:uncharacterized protein N7529_004791 [Penicillium soppii]|uniref:uncharacterized protein n=1 Tax=Penicillium soppii TaxID=69789 RepID=UPI002546BB86|nr:uncharacterized protein N7529_004791 [Penicillium soppii]KAJ5872438.1 hypothetical protein N7529_004791 [Penicillium soppii]